MPWIFVDAHVHLRVFAELSRLVYAAAVNFTQYERLNHIERSVRFLFLTEKAGEDVFDQLAGMAGRGDTPFPDLVIQPTGEANVLRVIGEGEAPVLLVAGRQIVTKEGIELLAIGRSEPYPDGATLEATYAALDQVDHLLILPWGVGKWLGQRGQIIAGFIKDRPDDQPFLGDNGNRPFFWPLPPHFHRPLDRGKRQLPGSDSLPLPGEERRAGGYGFYCHGVIDQQQPFAALASLLRTPHTQVYRYGKNEGLFRFLKHQLLMRPLQKTEKIPR